MISINSIIVKIKETHDDKVLINGENGTIELEIPLGNTIGDIEDTMVSNSNVRVRQYGEVVSTTILHKDSAEILYEKPAGFPAPTHYRDSNQVTGAMKRYKNPMYKGHRAMSYNPSSYEPEYTTFAEQEIDIRPKDKVYFNYLGYHEDNYIMEIDGWKHYLIPFSTVYCVVRDGEIRMVNGNVFAKPFYGEGLTELEVEGGTIWGKLFKDTDIIESIKETPKYLEAIVCHMGNPIGEDTRKTVSIGDRVLLTPTNVFKDYQFKDKIEGEEYFVVKQWDIMALVSTNIITPVGDYVTINPYNIMLNDKRKVYNPDAKEQEFESGQIFLLEDSVNKAASDSGSVALVGELAQDLTQGMNVRFKGGLYLDEYGVLIIRENGVWGVVE